MNLASVALAATTVLTACDNPVVVQCPARFFPSLVIDVRDINTGAPAWINARVVAIHEDRAVFFDLPPSLPDSTESVLYRSKSGSVGTFDVFVDKGGYEQWIRLGVKVEGTDPPCVVAKTVTLTALLRPR